MEDTLDAPHRSPNRPPVQHVALNLLDLELGRHPPPGSLSHQDTQLVPALHQQPGEVGADEPCRAGEERAGYVASQSMW